MSITKYYSKYYNMSLSNVTGYCYLKRFPLPGIIFTDNDSTPGFLILAKRHLLNFAF